MQHDGRAFYEAAWDRQRDLALEVGRDRMARPRRRDPAGWTAILEPTIGIGCLVYLFSEILTAGWRHGIG
jgi:hypothetical protein